MKTEIEDLQSNVREMEYPEYIPQNYVSKEVIRARIKELITMKNKENRDDYVGDEYIECMRQYNVVIVELKLLSGDL